ncbi:LysE family transporter [Empedobacter falsenii]|uniref:LysE family transporter n=1 Tax=Empedobacter TaxID=59734 RepID=UPI001DBC5A37|nr:MULTISPECIES: LysE family transporter [unclassified Empedobacter]MDM1523687.1 LysE family transporter [Empedobacter sp. 225-1]MDM1542548.1 LysE family transporter [Empedobacter sp. 189-2]HJD87046.1 LysE family transporter [Empedobacter falsenii]
MQYLELLLIGIFTAFIGSSIPGLLNMTVVKIGKQEGTKSAYTFMLGTAITIAIQVYLAIFLAKFINFNEEVTKIFRQVGLTVFVMITIYFLFFAKKQDLKKKNKRLKQQGDVKQKNKFLYGLLLSAVNVFPIPFYVFLSATLISYKITVFGQPNSSIFALGVVIGSMIIFSLYLKFFNSKSEENSFILKNINYVIGGVTSVVSILTIYQLFL